MSKSPDAFRTISEVAEWLDRPTHVLRFWESKFPQIKPVKRAGGRRYYRPQDMLLLGGIKKLLHDDGMTIKGVQKLIKEQGVATICSFSQPLEDGLVAEDVSLPEVLGLTGQAMADDAPMSEMAEAEDSAELLLFPEMNRDLNARDDEDLTDNSPAEEADAAPDPEPEAASLAASKAVVETVTLEPDTPPQREIERSVAQAQEPLVAAKPVTSLPDLPAEIGEGDVAAGLLSLALRRRTALSASDAAEVSGLMDRLTPLIKKMREPRVL